MANAANPGQDAGWYEAPHETSTPDPNYDTSNDWSLDFDLDQWINPDYFTTNGANLRKDHGQVLSPPLYAGFFDQKAGGSDTPILKMDQPPGHPAAPENELKDLVRTLQVELEEKSRKLDALHDYMEQLQPWTEDINNLVQGLIEKQNAAALLCGDLTSRISPIKNESA